MDKKRIDEYLSILKSDNSYYEVAKRLIGNNDKSYEDKMCYLVWAPIIVSFVNWLIVDAKREGIKRLYFLSRDAYPAYIVTRILGGEEIDVRYLRVSRQSLRVPEYHMMGENCIDRIFISGIDVNLRKILQRARLSENEIKTIAEELGVDSRQILNRRQIIELREKARSSSNLFDYIYAHSKKESENAVSYLVQNGMTDGCNYAIVDSGWIGTIQQSLLRILQSVKKNIQIRGYYFGLYEIPKDVCDKDYKAYYFNNNSGLMRKYHFSNCLFEAVYSENAPMVMTYEKCGDRVEPVYSETGALNGDRLLKGIINQMSFVGEYVCMCNGDTNPDINIQRRITDRLIKTLMFNPNTEEAVCYGGYEFSDDLSDTEHGQLAAILSREEIDKLCVLSKFAVMVGISKKILHESAWIEGTCARLKNYRISAMKRAKFVTVLRQQVKQLCLKR